MIVITDTDLECTLKNLLQRQLKLRINNKVWREGRLLLFNQSGFYVEFIINGKKKARERFELPIPFKINTINKSRVQFSYEVQSLSGKNKLIYELLKSVRPINKSKYYDNVLDIEIISDIK
jgi:hypothetical protein